MVEGLMARLHEIESDQRTAFASRIKHLQRLGFPAGLNTGKGRAAAYDAHHLFLIGFSLELAQLGLATDAAIPIMQDNMQVVRNATEQAIAAIKDVKQPCTFIYFDPARLDPLMLSRGGGMVSMRGKFRFGTSQFGNNLLSGAGVERRFTVISVNGLIESLASFIGELDREKAQQFIDDLATWAGGKHD